MEAPARLARIDYVGEFAAAVEWFATHLSEASPRSVVPACPGWTVLDLVVHLGNVHSWAATIVETGEAAAELDDRPHSSRAKHLGPWYLAKAEDLYEVLRFADPDRPCWNFAFGEGVAGFWQRRQAHETLVHGVDLAQALGVEPRLPAELAGDGVDEALTVFLHRMHQRGYAAELPTPVALRAVDTGQSWTVQPGVEGASPRVARGVVMGADVVEGTAAELLLALWKRGPLEALSVTGDQDRVRRFLAGRLTA